jgi:hypothetical protein
MTKKLKYSLYSTVPLYAFDLLRNWYHSTKSGPSVDHRPKLERVDLRKCQIRCLRSVKVQGSRVTINTRAIIITVRNDPVQIGIPSKPSYLTCNCSRFPDVPV